jgi:pimeloyl-ACP methyl ester carboxylesterase
MMQTTTLKFVTVVLAFSSTTTTTTLSLPSSSSSCRDQRNYHRHSAYNQRLISHPSTTRRCLTSVSSTTMLQQSTSVATSVERQDTTGTVSLAWTEFFSPKAASDPTTTATPVLLLHGLLGSKRNFSSLGRMLGIQLDQPRRILGVDLRNHGDSQHAECMSYVEMAQDVIEFLDSQKLEKIVLVGHSMGGKVAQALALLYPHRVEGLVVLDIAPVKYLRDLDPHWKAVEDILHAIHEVIESPMVHNTPTEIDKALCPSIPDPALRAFVLTNYDHRKQQWRNNLNILQDLIYRPKLLHLPLREMSLSFMVDNHDLYDMPIWIPYRRIFPIICLPLYEVLDIGSMLKHQMMSQPYSNGI